MIAEIRSGAVLMSGPGSLHWHSLQKHVIGDTRDCGSLCQRNDTITCKSQTRTPIVTSSTKINRLKISSFGLKLYCRLLFFLFTPFVGFHISFTLSILLSNTYHLFSDAREPGTMPQISDGCLLPKVDCSM